MCTKIVSSPYDRHIWYTVRPRLKVTLFEAMQKSLLLEVEKFMSSSGVVYLYRVS